MNKYTQTTKTSTSATSARRRKTEGYNSATLHVKRDSRRIEAEDRQRERDSRTSRQQWTLCQSRPGQSKRETKRLEKAMMAESQVVS